jgi:hypothetical protein
MPIRTLGRLRWLFADTVRVGRALARVRRDARAPDPPRVSLARLEGGPWAARGRLNAYRVRVVNEHASARTIAVHVAGDDGRPRTARAERVVPPHAAVDLVLLTDWDARFDLVDTAPPDDPLAFLAAPDATAECRVTAALETDGRVVETLVIAQPLAR